MQNFPGGTPWRMALALALVAVVILVVGVVACGGFDDSPEAEVGWTELLAHIPDTEETRQWTVIHDIARARNDLGLEVPDQDATDEEVFHGYILDVMSGDDGSLWVNLQGGFVPQVLTVQHYEIREEVGFSVLAVDQWVFGGREADEYTMLRGRFNEDRIDETLHNDPDYSELLKEDSHEDVSYYSWPDAGDSETRAHTEIHPRKLHSLAVNDNSVYWSLSQQAMREMIEAGTGNTRSLADREDHQLLAEELDRLGVWAALLSTDVESQSGDPAQICIGDCTEDELDEIQHILDEEPRLLPYTVYASGAGTDESGAFLGIIIVHEDAEAAQKNVGRFRERVQDGWSINAEGLLEGAPWEEVLFQDGSPPESYLDVSADGRVLTARIRLNMDRPSGQWYWWRDSNDPLLLWQE